MKIIFEVGTVEKHQINFSWNAFWGTLRIAVDGRTVQASGVTLLSPMALAGNLDAPDGEKWKFGPLDIGLVKRWTVPVGDQEKHLVVIEKERARWFAGLRPHRYRVLVDEKCVKECEGY